MSSPSSTSPGLFETMNIVIDRYMAEVHTCMPGTVVSYDLATQTAVVQPLLKRHLAGQAVSLPQLHDVPVVFPATATTWLRLPVTAGDPVMLHFSEASLDKWWPGGGEVDPEIPTRFSLGDAIATPGLHAKPQAIVPRGAPGSVELVNGLAWLEITADGRFKVTNGAADLLSVLDAILGHLIALSTTPAVPGAPCLLSPLTISQLALDKVSLATLKAS